MPSLSPYVPSSEEVVRTMLQLARLKAGDILYDLGSGDGRILIMAAREFGVKAVGVELREDLVAETRNRIRDLKLEDRIKLIHGDMMNIDISDADVITLYLTDNGNEKLKPKLEKSLKPGTRIISRSFRIPGWEPVQELQVEWDSFYLYLKK